MIASDRRFFFFFFFLKHNSSIWVCLFSVNNRLGCRRGPAFLYEYSNPNKYHTFRVIGPYFGVVGEVEVEVLLSYDIDDEMSLSLFNIYMCE